MVFGLQVHFSLKWINYLTYFSSFTATFPLRDQHLYSWTVKLILVRPCEHLAATNLTESQQTVTVASVLQRGKELEPMFQSNEKITVCPREGTKGGNAKFLKWKREEMSTLVSLSYPVICWMITWVQSTYIIHRSSIYTRGQRKNGHSIQEKGPKSKHCSHITIKTCSSLVLWIPEFNYFCFFSSCCFDPTHL